MAYATGSGDYIALMNAVLAFAVADGWIEAAGPGTGWPISKGNIGGVDWDTTTIARTDFTGSTALSITERRIRLGLGNTTSEATANIGDTASITNMQYPISQWHIFSDPSIGDHVNVVVEVSTPNYSEVYSHFSFGEIDRNGLAGSAAYAAANFAFGFAEDIVDFNDFYNENTYPGQAASWMHPAEISWMWNGDVGSYRARPSQFNYIINPTDIFIPQTTGWPAAGVYNLAGVNVLAASAVQDDANTIIPSSAGFETSNPVNYAAFQHTPQPFSGGVTLAACPIIFTSGSSSAARIIWAGSAPNVRICSMEGYNPGDSVTFGSDEWLLFPALRKSPVSELGIARSVTSGPCGYAYKRVI